MPGARINIGDVEVVCLTDAIVNYPWPLEQLFPGVPLDAWEPYRARYPDAFGGPDVWRSWYRCFLLRSPTRTVLFDTGMGPAGSPLASVFRAGGRLQEELDAAGVAAGEIDIVVLSHLHPDHVGGNLRHEGGSVEPAFPNASYVASELDWTAFQRPEVQAHFPFAFVEESITPLQSLGVIELFAEEHRVTEELALAPAPGHTPGHTIATIESAGERAVLLADTLLHPAQITEPDWSSMFDMNPDQERQTRRRLLDQLEHGNVLFAASHFPDPGFGRIARDGAHRYWTPIAADDGRVAGEDASG